MTSVILKQQAVLGSWGKCVGLRLTGNLRKIPGFTVGDIVDIEITENGLSVSKRKETISEMALLQDMTAYTAHADEALALLANETEY